MRSAIFTIGHSTHGLEALLDLLRSHEVTAVADVRSSPYSRYNPQFNRDGLERQLTARGIRYVFLGEELGGRSEDPSCYQNGRVCYERLARTPRFKEGIQRVFELRATLQVALMCAEREPLDCHRTLLIAPALEERGVQVRHILADGSLELHQRTMDRLLALVGLPAEDLFHSREELVAEAIARRAERIAYVDKKLAARPAGGSE